MRAHKRGAPSQSRQTPWKGLRKARSREELKSRPLSARPPTALRNFGRNSSDTWRWVFLPARGGAAPQLFHSSRSPYRANLWRCAPRVRGFLSCSPWVRCRAVAPLDMLVPDHSSIAPIKRPISFFGQRGGGPWAHVRHRRSPSVPHLPPAGDVAEKPDATRAASCTASGTYLCPWRAGLLDPGRNPTSTRSWVAR